MTDLSQPRAALIVALEAGTFLPTVYRMSVEQPGEDQVVADIAALHNQGLLDAVDAFAGLSTTSQGAYDFFLTRHVFERVLPHLEAPIAQVMRCVLTLSREAGRDLAAGTIFNSYVEFCLRDPTRPFSALDLIKAAPEELGDVLPATIAAGSRFDHKRSVEELLHLIQDSASPLRARAIFAVSSIRWPEQSHIPRDLLTALEVVANHDAEGDLLASTIRAGESLYGHDNSLEPWLIALLRAALRTSNDQALYAASLVLWQGRKQLPDCLVVALVEGLASVKPDQRGTLDNIDYGIATLLKTTAQHLGLGLLEDVLTNSRGAIGITAFDSVEIAIRGSAELLDKIVTRWLGLENPMLYRALEHLVTMHHGDDLIVNLIPDDLVNRTSKELTFLAHKAIGYFFFKPVVATSIIISLMRHSTDDESVDALAALISDPLLLNYTGSVRDYVAKRLSEESGPVRNALERCLISIDDYLDSLRSVPSLPSLGVAQTDRESYRRYMADHMNRAMKAAEEKSILSSLFSRSTILYGRKFVNYVYSGDGQSRRLEAEMAQHGVSMEMPRMEQIDPCGLDFMIRVFRLERRSP